MRERIESLRREGRLQEARRLGEDSVACADADAGCCAALFDVYLDIARQCIDTGVTSYLPGISERMAQLLPDIDDGGRSLKLYNELLKSQLPHSRVITDACKLSKKSGHEDEAYSTLTALGIPLHQLPHEFHEEIGYVIYRYARTCISHDRPSTIVRCLLRDYLALDNERPSALHSLILRLAVRLARTTPEFNFGRFFEMWQPRYLTAADVTAGPDGTPSLLARVVETILASDAVDRLPDLLSRVRFPAKTIMEVVREACYRRLASFYGNGNEEDAAAFLDVYISHCSLHASSIWHSRILAVALKIMQGDRARLFPQLLIDWDTDYLRPEDWTGTDPTVRPLATRALRHCFETVRRDVPRYAALLPRIIDMFGTAACRVADNSWLRRKQAVMLEWSGRHEEAVGLFRNMVREDDRDFHVWRDFADIVSERPVRTGLLAKALLAARGDERLAASVRLSMAQMLHLSDDDRHAAVEIAAYEKACGSLCAEPTARYHAVKATIGDAGADYSDNTPLYFSAARIADEYVYADIPSIEMSVTGVDDDGRCTLTDGRGTTIDAGRADLPQETLLKTGESYAVKFMGREGCSHRVLTLKLLSTGGYTALPERIAHVGSVDNDSDTATVYCANRPEPITIDRRGAVIEQGQFIRFRSFTDKGNTCRGVEPHIVDAPAAWRHFRTITAAVHDIDTATATARLALSPDIAGCELPLGEIAVPEIEKGCRIRLIHYFRTDNCGVDTVVPLHGFAADGNDACDAIKTVSGAIKLAPDGNSSFVKDVVIPVQLLHDAGITPDTYVTATAILIPAQPHSPQTARWQALSITPYT